MSFHSKHAEIWYVYQDWTLEPMPRCFYVGKGDQRRLWRKYRSKHHKHVAEKHGMNRVVLFGSRDEAYILEEEIKLIAQMHTYVYDPSYNGIGTNYTQGGEGISGHRDTPVQQEHRRIGQTLAWQDPNKRAVRVIARNRPEVNDKLRPQASASQRANWQDPEYRRTQSAAIKVAQNNPVTREKKRIRTAIMMKKQWQENREARLAVLQSPEYREKQRLTHVGKSQRCGLCGETGHKRRTCPKAHNA